MRLIFHNFAQYTPMLRLSKDFRVCNMEQYIVPLLMDHQDGLCTHCEEPLEEYQIHHKRYGMDITIYDLELIHGRCHADEHGVADVKGKQRKA